jgi:hypothetical protein
MTLRTQLAYAAAGVLGLLGLLGLLNPAAAAGLFGLGVGTGRGLSEVRSTYGALFLTMSGLVLWAIQARPKASPLLRTIGVLWLGAAAGRVASLLIDGFGDVVNVLLLLVQLAVGGVLLWASLESEKARIEARVRREQERTRQAQRPTRAARAKPGAPDVARAGSPASRPPDAGRTATPASRPPGARRPDDASEGGLRDGAPEGGLPPQPPREASDRP